MSNTQQHQNANDKNSQNLQSNQRTWIILDELASIQKIPSLSQGLSVARSYGGCFVLGAQNIAQLREIYGYNLTQSISSECNTRVFFKTNDPDTASWICDNIGHTETVQYKEALSYGAHAMRDGVNVGAYEKTQSLILPSEIINMPKLNLLIKLPDFGCIKASIKYKVRQNIAECLKTNTKLMQEMQDMYANIATGSIGGNADLKSEAILNKDARVTSADIAEDNTNACSISFDTTKTSNQENRISTLGEKVQDVVIKTEITPKSDAITSKDANAKSKNASKTSNLKEEDDCAF